MKLELMLKKLKFKLVFPVILMTNSERVLNIFRNIVFCWITRGIVGAQKNIFPLNQRWKLYITQEEINVFPSPVGRHTKVLFKRQFLTMLNWYSLKFLLEILG